MNAHRDIGPYQNKSAFQRRNAMKERIARIEGHIKWAKQFLYENKLERAEKAMADVKDELE